MHNKLFRNLAAIALSLTLGACSSMPADTSTTPSSKPEPSSTTPITPHSNEEMAQTSSITLTAETSGNEVLDTESLDTSTASIDETERSSESFDLGGQTDEESEVRSLETTSTLTDTDAESTEFTDELESTITTYESETTSVTSTVPDVRSEMSAEYFACDVLSFVVDGEGAFELTVDEHAIPVTVQIDAKVLLVPNSGEMSVNGTVNIITSGQQITVPMHDYVLYDQKLDRYNAYLMNETKSWDKLELTPGQIPFEPTAIRSALDAMSTQATLVKDEAKDTDRLEFSLPPTLFQFMMMHLSPNLPAMSEVKMTLDLDGSRTPYKLSMEVASVVGQTLVNNYLDNSQSVKLTVGKGTYELLHFDKDSVKELPIAEALLAAYQIPRSVKESSVEPTPKKERIELGDVALPRPMNEKEWDQLGGSVYDIKEEKPLIDEAEMLHLAHAFAVDIQTEKGEGGSPELVPYINNSSNYILQSFAATYEFKERTIKVDTDSLAVLPKEDSKVILDKGSVLTPDMVVNEQLDSQALTLMVAYFIDRNEQITLLNVVRKDDGTLTASIDGNLLVLEKPDFNPFDLLPKNIHTMNPETNEYATDLTNKSDQTIGYYHLLLEDKETGERFTLLHEGYIKPNETIMDISFVVDSKEQPKHLRPLFLEIQLDETLINYDFRLGRVIRANY